MTKPNFRPIQPLDANDAELDRVNERLGVPTMVRPAPKSLLPSPPAPIANAVRIATPPRRQEKLTTRLPGYLVDAMKVAALERRTTVRHIMLLALKDTGFVIEPEDLSPDARKPS